MGSRRGVTQEVGSLRGVTLRGGTCTKRAARSSESRGRLSMKKRAISTCAHSNGGGNEAEARRRAEGGRGTREERRAAADCTLRRCRRKPLAKIWVTTLADDCGRFEKTVTRSCLSTTRVSVHAEATCVAGRRRPMITDSPKQPRAGSVCRTSPRESSSVSSSFVSTAIASGSFSNGERMVT